MDEYDSTRSSSSVSLIDTVSSISVTSDIEISRDDCSLRAAERMEQSNDIAQSRDCDIKPSALDDSPFTYNGYSRSRIRILRDAGVRTHANRTCSCVAVFP